MVPSQYPEGSPQQIQFPLSVKEKRSIMNNINRILALTKLNCRVETCQLQLVKAEI